MKHTFFLAPSGPDCGLTSVSLGVFRALDKHGIRVGFSKPISQIDCDENNPDPSCKLIEETSGYTLSNPISFDAAEKYVRNDQMDDLMEIVVEKVGENNSNDFDVMIVEGLLPTEGQTFPNRINKSIVTALNAEVIMVSSMAEDSPEQTHEELEMSATLYGGWNSDNVIGCILNKVQTSQKVDTSLALKIGQEEVKLDKAKVDAELAELKAKVLETPMFKSGEFDLIGFVPWNSDLPSVRVSDIAKQLNAEIINEGDMATRRVNSVSLCARNVSNIMHVYKTGSLLVAPSDRHDILLTSALAAVGKIPMAGIILTRANDVNEKVLSLCKPAFDAGLPVLSVQTDSFATATELAKMSNEVPSDDSERYNAALDFISRKINIDKLQSRVDSDLEFRMSPAAFRYQLSKRAREANKRIILPEGDEPRTIQAAAICQSRGLARCVLLGDPVEIKRIADGLEVDLGDIEIINPKDIQAKYVDWLVEKRKHKNMVPEQAKEALEDTVMLGTVMLANDEVDGLVSGAVHSSASTVRPALQLIKTRPDAKVVSSVFFMCLPDQVLVYGDCAVNPDPDPESLADIAVQSAESAGMFGIPSRVALISYSTGTSGSGADVEKVREATKIAKESRPDLLIDGPLQYDAANMKDVAEKKAPDSPVAGKATVYVFPDLNTGNTTYKAVQRSANVISIGPMLQGLRKPVNDLSRGALVEDIVYTIAITAIQAVANDEK